MAKYVKEINSEEYQKEIENNKGLIILDFYSTECSPCDALAPKFEDLSEQFHEAVKFYKIFRQDNRDLALSFGVSGSPSLVFIKDGKDTGKRLSGGIKKSEILQLIKENLDESTFNSLYKKKEIKKEKVDLIILGGGPAGLSAALYASQAKLNTVVVDSALPGGQVMTTHLISNYPGTGKAVGGWDLSDKMHTQAMEAGAKFYSAVDISSVVLEEGNNKVLVDDELELQAPAIILAMGAEPRALGVPGEKEFKGKGISYCATCDGKFYEGMDVVVIGGGNSAVEESLFLTKFASKVTIVHQFDHLQANKQAQEKAMSHEKINFIWDSEPRKFEVANNKVKIEIENIKTKEKSELTSSGVFVFVGMAPNIENVSGTALKQNDWGYLECDEDMQTNVPGIFAAGDIRSKKIRQAITAASDGCIAAINAEKFIEAKSDK